MIRRGSLFRKYVIYFVVLGSIALKGFAQPIQAFNILGLHA